MTITYVRVTLNLAEKAKDKKHTKNNNINISI